MAAQIDLAALITAFKNGQKIFVVTDVDQTLTAPAADQSKVNLVPGVLEVLAHLVGLGVEVIIASARDIDVLKGSFGAIEGLHYIANEGCLMNIAGKEVPLVQEPDFAACNTASKAFARTLLDVTATQMGFFYGIFISKQDENYYDAETLLKRFSGEALAVERHSMGLTLEPKDKPGKQVALARALEELGIPSAAGIYAGDDKNDVEAQRWMVETGRIAVLVENKAGGAKPDYVTGTVSGAVGWVAVLKQLAEALA